ncbi:aminopeptidase P family protein [Solirubrobacter phytolaccae]|uniref:Aminopeptidase P family protein n=1 Tax=Solirubrobacter phytolaccae TaxID=1404360 RepID=A0A9X3NL47_9ACTN|nr:M24 family metallopeptidase [Solirubrobacter phytolaccae]MDA0183477.1 aminopeptidase P family protein [Solirubrobacter phytolaccae]
MDVLIDADTVRSPELRHEVPAAILDPFLYGEREGNAFAAVSALDAANIAKARPELRQVDVMSELGLMELIAGGMGRAEALLEVRARACEVWGITEAAVPPTFPLATARYLEARGITLHVDGERFAARRRRKNAAELEGIKRATRAAEHGLRAAREALREGLTCEELRTIVRQAVEPHAALGEFTVATGPDTATGHGSSSGPISAGQPVIVDLWPQDRATATFSDIARTFVVREPDPEIARWHGLVQAVLEDALEQVRPGIEGKQLYARACDRFEAEGFHTQRKPGKQLMEGFPTALGHGVGLEVHEDPGLGRSGTELLPGDVITLEPFLCRPGFGGVQIEEIVLVTENGAELLSDHPRSL